MLQKKEVKRNLTFNDFLLTSYGQTRKQVEKDYQKYLETGLIG